MILKIDKLNSPPTIGEVYLVPCVKIFMKRNWYNVPLINNLHTDKENGQFEPHYHVDTRFLRRLDSWFVKRVYPHEYSNFKIEYLILKCYKQEEVYKTHPNLIKNSKLKHKCIHKGKCPHRGMNLSQVVPNENGEIICPLHGLKFNKEGKLIKSL